jgi:DNA-binding response OmpR family regulator
MSNSEVSYKGGGFLRRLFKQPEVQEAPAEAGPSRGSDGAIAMTPVVEHIAGRRLAKSKTVLMIAAADASTRRWRTELEQWGYGVESVEDGVKGLDILYGFAFDALLIDFTAPRIDGLDLLKEIRGHDELKGMFVGMFVRDREGSTEDEISSINAGANRVFQRQSVKPEEILTALKTALFPRILQAQPRARGGTAKTEAPRPAGTSTPASNGAANGLPMPIRFAAENAAAPVKTPGASKKILLIDGDESVAGIYRAQIEAAGYEVEVALDGETGFHDLYTINPDALLLDLLLPGLSGSEILKKTRAQKKFEKTPILVFTNIYTRDVEDEAKAAGALRLFNKAACTPRDVVDALNEIFQPSGAVLGGASRPSIKFEPDAAAENSAASAVPTMSSEALAAARGNGKGGTDSEFQIEIRESMLQGAPEDVKTLRSLLQVLLRSQADPQAQTSQLLELYTRVHSLTANAAIAGFTKVARLSGALEAMLREFQARPDGINASTKRTLTQAIDFLAILFTGAATHESGRPLNEQILVVDDEIISRRVIGHSLEKAGLKSTAVSHPDEALALLEERPFDLIFLDVEMPGMDGFQLCKRLRAMPMHAKTPVIFVTALNGFESKAKSSLSGGDDFIGKPFSYIELAVKALIYVLRGSINDKGPRKSAPVPESAAA